MDLELLHKRARIIHNVRSFFWGKEYLETDTPLLAPNLIPESCLEVFETRRHSPIGSLIPEKSYWLIPSPEIWMKRLIRQHQTNLFQICKCFRNGEAIGRQHNSEFTMLEYYTMHANYLDSLCLTEELFAFLLNPNHENQDYRTEKDSNCLTPPFIRISIEEAFWQWAGFDLFKTSAAYTDASGAMEEEAIRLGLNPVSGLSVPELYDLIFIHVVEPKLKMERPVALLDYPAFVPCLAKKSEDGKTVERWELYIDGIELANCFSEETNAEEVRRFFESEKAEKEKCALVKHDVDENYWKIFLPGKNSVTFPPCSGVAMGLDRLIMLLTGCSAIDGILPFPME